MEIMFMYLTIAVLVLIGVYYLIAFFKEKNERLRQEETLINLVGELDNDFSAMMSRLQELNEAYYIFNDVDGLRREHKALRKQIAECPDSARIAKISSCLPLYKSLLERMQERIDNPERFFDKKIYDPLDDSLLKDPVELTINHPKLGPVRVKVNRENAKKYVDPKYGPKYFRMDARRNHSHVYLVSSSRTIIHDRYIEDRDSGFGLLDFMIWHSLLCDNHGHISDVGFVGGGGDAGGAGATSSYYYTPEPEVMPEQDNFVQESAPVVTDHEVSRTEEIERQGDPVIADPFPAEEDRASTESGVPNAEPESYGTSVVDSEPVSQSGTSY